MHFSAQRALNRASGGAAHPAPSPSQLAPADLDLATMLAASCCASRVGVNRAIGQGQRRPSLQPRQAGCRRPSRHPALRPLAFREQNGSGSALQATPDQIHATKVRSLGLAGLARTGHQGKPCARLPPPPRRRRD